MFFFSWQKEMALREYQQELLLRRESTNKRWRVTMLGRVIFCHFWGPVEMEETGKGTHWVRHHMLTLGFISARDGKVSFKGIGFYDYLYHLLLLCLPFIGTQIEIVSFVEAVAVCVTFSLLFGLLDYLKDGKMISYLLKCYLNF